MTNGEVLQKTYPNSELDTLSTKIVFTLEPRILGQQVFVFDKDWWNAEYIEPMTKNDLADEYVSRKALMVILSDYYDTTVEYSSMLREIAALPTVTSQPCEDAVSRQAVLDEAFEVDTKEYGRIYVVGEDHISSLPPVIPQPKKGRWIEERDDYGKIIHWHCSNCYDDSGFMTTCKWDYCPNCGSDNREVEE